MVRRIWHAVAARKSLEFTSARDLIMQDRYTADVGDYLKLGILRALSPGYRLGVAWWLYPDESHNQDGRHIGYLSQPDQWRHHDPDLFDALGQIVSSGQRDVRALEAANLLPDASFASDVILTGGPIAQRRQARHAWFLTVQRTLEAVDLVFADPDMGWNRPGSAMAPPRLARASRSARYGCWQGQGGA